MTVEKTADFAAAFEAARDSGKPSIIHLKVDPEAITPDDDDRGDPREGAGRQVAELEQPGRGGCIACRIA